RPLDAAARQGLHLLHRRDRERSRRRRLCGVCERQVRLARRRPEHGEGARAEEHPCRASRHRRRRRHRFRTRTHQATLGRGRARAARAGPAHESGLDRGGLLAALSPAARRLDLPAPPPPPPADPLTMAKVEFHFDFGSPNAYLAPLVIPRVEQRTGAKFAYVPVLLGGVFKLTNNRSPAESLQGIRNKPEYEALERQRFVRRHDITRF